MTVEIKINEKDYKWIKDHCSKKYEVADIVHELIQFWEQCQNNESIEIEL